jgi:dTDP-4-dehydrorhamnose reductase
MLGTELSLLLEKSGLAFAGTDREVDIGDAAELAAFAGKQTFNWIINCAAYTAVDKAEEDAENCRRLNTLGAGNIAACAKSIGASLIHISTDYVFDGSNSRPYKEEDATNPAGVYGMSKRDGELAVLEKQPCSYIIRTAWLYGKYGSNFVHTMLRLMNERDQVTVVNDQRGSPTWTFDLAGAVLAIINAVESGRSIPCGIYHYTGEGNISWFDFAKEIYRQGREQGRIAKDCEVRPCSGSEYPTKAKRPAWSVLDKTKIKAALNIEIPAWDLSLKEFFRTCAS